MSYCFESSVLPETHQSAALHINLDLISSNSDSSVSTSSANVPDLNIFQPYRSHLDLEALALISKLEDMVLNQTHSSEEGLRTKDPVLDIFIEVIRLYGLKIQFFYQNIDNDLYYIKGVKSASKLHGCLYKLAKTLRHFPCGLIKSLGLSFILCEGLEIKDEKLKSSETTLVEAIVIEKNGNSEEVLQKHFFKIVFVYILRKNSQRRLAAGCGSEVMDFKQAHKAFCGFVVNNGKVDAKAFRNASVVKFIQTLGIDV